MENQKDIETTPIKIAENLSKIQKPYFSPVSPENDVRVELKPEDYDNINLAIQYLNLAYSPEVEQANIIRKIGNFYPLMLMLIIWSLVVFGFKLPYWNWLEISSTYLFIIGWFVIGYHLIIVKHKF